MPRSWRPSVIHLRAIDSVRAGHTSACASIHSRHLVGELRLQQVEVLRLAHLEVGAPGDGRPRVDQVGGVEHPGAVLALVAAGVRVAAVRAGADDVAVGQEPAVDR